MVSIFHDLTDLDNLRAFQHTQNPGRSLKYLKSSLSVVVFLFRLAAATYAMEVANKLECGVAGGEKVVELFSVKPIRSLLAIAMSLKFETMRSTKGSPVTVLGWDQVRVEIGGVGSGWGTEKDEGMGSKERECVGSIDDRVEVSGGHEWVG
ncbi:unnamed protein product [Prunus armeniaca]